MASKKDWKTRTKHAEARISDLEYLISHKDEEFFVLEARFTSMRTWAEALASSPEIKADIESAFKRGETHQRRKFAHWLATQAALVNEQVQADQVEADTD